MPRKALTELQAEIQPLERLPKPSSQEELSELCKPFVPARTQVNNRWALSVFTKWLAARNSRVTDSKDMFPTNLLEVSHPCATIDVVLAAFVFEARRADWNYYPGTTIKNILAALHRVTKANLGVLNVFNFVEKESRERHYPMFQSALDRHLRMFIESGICLFTYLW